MKSLSQIAADEAAISARIRASLDEKRRWLWRAWNSKRARMCDSGYVAGKDDAEAQRNAWICLGGPWAKDVSEIEVEEIV